MHRAATTSRFLTGRSSKVELADSEFQVSRVGSLQDIVARYLAQSTIYSQALFLNLTNELIQLAEQDFGRRDLSGLEEVSRILMNLPVDAARQIGAYYYGFAIHRKGRTDEAKSLLRIVADSAPITYRARAIQTLGGIHHYLGEIDEAFRLQLEALRMAEDRDAHGLQTAVLARWELSIIRSLHGDHKGALSDLRSLAPLFFKLTKRTPFYYYAYNNALAIELGELGHLEEAESASRIALACPFAFSYPEWAETRQELEAKRTSATPSVVPVRQTAEGIPASRTRPQPCQKHNRVVAFCSLIIKGTAFQITLILIAALKATPDHRTTIDILDRLGRCIRARAPPPHH